MDWVTLTITNTFVFTVKNFTDIDNQLIEFSYDNKLKQMSNKTFISHDRESWLGRDSKRLKDYCSSIQLERKKTNLSNHLIKVV